MGENLTYKGHINGNIYKVRHLNVSTFKKISKNSQIIYGRCCIDRCYTCIMLQMQDGIKPHTVCKMQERLTDFNITVYKILITMASDYKHCRQS